MKSENKYILKKELSIEWLDENCKIIASIPNHKLYLCGDYKIEVLI